MKKVCVVVPIYNAGEYLDRCLDSLVAQTMPADEFEMLFVDDGSTDESPQKLDDYAQRVPNMRVVHQENSGWPGKPRNVGIDLADAEYIQFVDQDDHLGAEALDRLYALATRTTADIVLPKLAGDAGFNQDLYKLGVEHCTVWDQPLMNSLGPHKLFRRSFLVQHGLRFPEGRRRLEDAVFMGQAYVAAKNVSILADYPCYYWRVRDDGKNNSKVTPTPRPEYYRYFREAIDAVVDGTEEGEDRDALLRRYYRTLLSKVSEPRLQRYRPATRTSMFDEVRAVVLERCGPGVEKGLPALMRLRGRLLREGRLDDLVSLAKTAESITCDTSMETLTWDAGCLSGVVRSRWRMGERPITVTKRHGRYFLDSRITADLADADQLDVTRDVESASASCSLQGRHTLVRWFTDSSVRLSLEPVAGSDEETYAVCFTGSVHIDPLHVAGGRPLDADVWDIRIHADFAGLRRDSRPGKGPAATVSSGRVPALLGEPPVLVRPYWTRPAGNLSLRISSGPETLGRLLAGGGTARPRVRGSRMTARVDGLHVGPAGASWPVELVVRSGLTHRSIPGRLEGQSGRGILSLDLGAVTAGDTRVIGRYRLGVLNPSTMRPSPIAEVWVLRGRWAVTPWSRLRDVPVLRSPRVRRRVRTFARGLRPRT